MFDRGSEAAGTHYCLEPTTRSSPHACTTLGRFAAMALSAFFSFAPSQNLFCHRLLRGLCESRIIAYLTNLLGVRELFHFLKRQAALRILFEESREEELCYAASET